MVSCARLHNLMCFFIFIKTSVDFILSFIFETPYVLNRLKAWAKIATGTPLNGVASSGTPLRRARHRSMQLLQADHGWFFLAYIIFLSETYQSICQIADMQNERHTAYSGESRSTERFQSICQNPDMQNERHTAYSWENPLPNDFRVYARVATIRHCF